MTARRGAISFWVITGIIIVVWIVLIFMITRGPVGE